MNIKNLIGIDYKNRGQNFNGCDCYGLAKLYYDKVLSIRISSYNENYINSDDNVEIGNIIDKNCLIEWVEVKELKVNDLIVFRVNRYPMHIGIYLGNDMFLHTMKSLKLSCIERLSSKTWNKRILKYFRYKGLKDE